MKKVILLLASMLLFVATAFAEEAPPPPEFSVGGGVYDTTVFLELKGQGAIYYTTDGSVPTTSSILYTGPIAITENTEALQAGRGKAPVNVPSGTVIRAVSAVNFQTSAVASQTYFVGKDIMTFFGGVPLVNLTMDPFDLWDPSNGIYSNFNYEHKVPATFQHYNAVGACDINRTTEVKVSGHGSRSNPKKSLRVYFKNTDPDQGKYLNYPLIPGNLDKNGQEINEYSKVTFRVSDWNYTDLRDVVAQKLGGSTKPDTAASVPMALFLNGKYWGLYECREQYDDDYVAEHYGVDHDDVVFLDRDWTLPPKYEELADTGKTYVDKMEYSAGPKDDNKKGHLGESYYRDQWNYVKSLVLDKNFSDPTVYAEFQSNVDVDNLIDFLIIYIYSANDDWPGNNFKLWRVTEEAIDPETYGADGKWRFMIHDFDIAFENIRHDTLRLSAFGTEPDTEARHPAYAASFIAGLLKNSEFRSEFAQRTRVYLSTILSDSSIRAITDELVAARKPGKSADLLRWGWGQNTDGWVRNTGSFVQFASGRSGVIVSQYTDILNSSFSAGISGQAKITITPQQAVAPSVQYTIAGANVRSGGSVDLFSGIPVIVEASSNDGTPLLVSITHGNNQTSSGFNKITFIPQPNESYNVTVTSYASAYTPPVPVIGIARADRFSKMKVGEALPAYVIDKDGNRVNAEFIIQGDCATIENGIVKATSPGRAALSAIYNGMIYSVPLIVN